MVGQRPDAGVGKEDVLAGEIRPGYDVVGLVQEVLYLLLVGDDVIEISIVADVGGTDEVADRKSTRLNSSHANISYAVFCLKKKKKKLFSWIDHVLLLHHTPL